MEQPLFLGSRLVNIKIKVQTYLILIFAPSFRTGKWGARVIDN